MKSKRILVAPLDWGLGHATRCIPIISELLASSCEVILAGSGHSLDLLKQEYPKLSYTELPAYNPVYPTSGSMVFKMVLQLPKFLSVIRREHDIINQIVTEHKIDVIISDNRYGCWSHKINSIFITHQLHILLPTGWQWLEKTLDYFNHRQIKKFNECWVPDYTGDKSLAGKLSACKGLAVKYIGPLSRFKSIWINRVDDVSHRMKYDVLVILSGPEPQRKILEDLLISQFCKTELKVMLVRGVPGNKTSINHNLKVVDFLNTSELHQAICHSEIIIARSGYSTLMDLAVLEKHAIFIPTPGQTEQAYLAKRVEINRIAYFAKQNEFDIEEALTKSQNYQGFSALRDHNNALEVAVAEMLLQSKLTDKIVS